MGKGRHFRGELAGSLCGGQNLPLPRSPGVFQSLCFSLSVSVCLPASWLAGFHKILMFSGSIFSIDKSMNKKSSIYVTSIQYIYRVYPWCFPLNCQMTDHCSAGRARPRANRGGMARARARQENKGGNQQFHLCHSISIHVNHLILHLQLFDILNINHLWFR